MRICSFLPSATEILFALGVGDQVVGVSHECDYPPEARQHPVVVRSVINQEELGSEAIDRAVHRSLAHKESLYRLDEATLRAAKPDLIVTQELCDVCAIDTTTVSQVLHVLSYHPQVVSLHPHNLSELFDEIRLVGEATGRREQAEQLVGSLRRRLDGIQSRLAKVTTRPRVFCLEWLKPPMASGHWVPEMVRLAGGDEVLGHAGEPSRYASWEEIVEAAPEIVILMPCGFPIERTRRELSLVTNEPSWRKLPAVHEHRVFLVNGPAYFNRSGPRLIDGIETLAGLIHPERCTDLIPEGAAEALDESR